MMNVIELRTERKQKVARPKPVEPASIVFFTGVRYMREEDALVPERAAEAMPLGFSPPDRLSVDQTGRLQA